MSTSTSTQLRADHHRTEWHSILAIVVAVVLALVGASVVASAANQLNISITSTFSPTSATIQTGTTVTWTNNDSQSHELRSTSGPVEFRTDPLGSGQTASVTFTTPGTYTYEDHQNNKSTAYRGTLVVVDGSVPILPAPATPPPASTPPAPTSAAVQLAGANFAPATVTVAVGGTVTWTNNDPSKHTVTADNGSFDSGTVNSGATFTHTFTAAGTYAYGCNFHGNMRGIVVVTAPPGTLPPTPGPPASPTPVTPTPGFTPPPATPTPGSTATSETVSISNNHFTPWSLSVNVGSSVTWNNADSVTHTVTADDQSFASGLVKPTTSWSHTFSIPGTFTYFCEIHPEMTGTVIAKAADGTAPLAATTVANAPVSAPAPGPSLSAATGSAASAGAATGTIAISDGTFTPASFRLAVGGTLTFINNGKAAHTVTAADGSFDSDMIRSGTSWMHTFPKAGSFAYTCILHPSMKGTVQVGGDESAGGNARSTESLNTANVDQSASSTETTAAAATNGALQPVNVEVADNQFNPNVATVAVGGTVTWKLSGDVAHTVTADDQSFNSGLMKPGESFQYTFNTLGSFTYMCLVHPDMTASINVVPPEEAAANQAAGPTPETRGPQAQPPPDAAAATAVPAPAGDPNLWGNTLLGIAAVLLACCALVFALRSFLTILTSQDADPQAAATTWRGAQTEPNLTR